MRRILKSTSALLFAGILILSGPCSVFADEISAEESVGYESSEDAAGTVSDDDISIDSEDQPDSDASREVEKDDADESIPQEAEVTENEEVIISEYSEESINPEYILPDNEELFENYMEREMYPGENLLLGNSRRASLNQTEAKIYDCLADHISEIAAGEKDQTRIFISADEYMEKTTYTLEELGGSKENAAAELSGRLKSFDANRVMKSLLLDYPYELYWYDKVQGITMDFSVRAEGKSDNRGGYYYKYSGDAGVTFAFFVASGYSASGEARTDRTDTSKTGAVKKAAANAREIVEKSGINNTDYKKLKYYKDEICRLTSYNYYAADNDIDYGDPWQLVYVFDGDPETNVVCEGYAKAFKYLCDLSSFSNPDIDCYIVSGKMNGESHMWNIVTMDNKKNYLADVTVCDSLASDHPFLTGGYRMQDGSGYVIRFGSESLEYVYDSQIVNIYDDELNLDNAVYTVDGRSELPVLVTGIKLNRTSASLKTGGSITLKATVSPSNAADSKIIWSSSNKNVAVVNSSGKVTAKTAGKTDIYAITRDGKFKAACRITVKTIPVQSVKLNKCSASIVKGYCITLKSTITPSNAVNKKITWNSSNPKIASVSQKGVVKGVGRGTATITVTTADGNKRASCRITVKNPVAVKSIKLNKTKAVIKKGQKITLKATISPEGATNRAVSWSTGNPEVASVSSSGVVKGLKKGTAAISVITKDGRKKAICKVTVK